MKEDWKECKLGEIGKIVGGATPSTKEPSNYNGGTIAWITPKDLSTYNKRFISHGERNITEKGLKSCSAQVMPKHTVLFTSRAPIGYIAISQNEVCTNQGFKSVIPNKDTDFMFLYYLLKYNKENIENLGSGTTFKEVSGSTMQNVIVKVPPLATQQKIAQILSSLDDKIELNNKINDNLEQQVTTVFNNMFNKYEQNHTNYKPLSTIAKFKYGTMPKKDKLGTGQYHAFSGYQLVGAYPEVMFENPQLIIVARGVGGCGDVKYTPANCYLTNLSIAIITEKTVHDDYLYHYLHLHDTKVMNTGSAQPQITVATLEKFEIPIPPEEELVLFSDFVQPFKQQYRNNLGENKRLSELRDSLLSKLMAGELDVDEVKV